MPKLNLHLHTTYSDGSNTLKEMALWLKGLGHCCLVTSDHDYWMSVEKYERQREESAQISAEIGFPIINALEISLWSEEAVLVGADACLRWLKEREDPIHLIKRSQTVLGCQDGYFNMAWRTMPKLLDGLNYGLCLVHPGLREQLDYSMFHAYEVMNSGSMWPEDDIARMRELMPTAKPVKGMDAHGKSDSEWCVESRNEVEGVIETEEQVIEWMKGVANQPAPQPHPPESEAANEGKSDA